MVPSDEGTSTGEIDSKVARLIEQYQLGEDYGEQLETLWTAEPPERESLRSLANRFNRRLLESAMTDAEISSVDGEVDNMYRLLTSDDVSSGNRTEASRRLEQQGVDVAQLEHDFITYQAVRSYLKEYRGAEYEQDTDETRIGSVVETIQQLQSRTKSVAERSLDQLKKTNYLTLGEFRIFVEINVLCENCDSQYSVVELLREGGCDCDGDKAVTQN